MIIPRAQFSLRLLLVAVLMVASFFGGVAFKRKEASEMRNALMEQKETNAKLSTQFRHVVKQLMETEKRLRQAEAENHAQADAP